jgi:hypothetical protein
MNDIKYITNMAAARGYKMGCQYALTEILTDLNAGVSAENAIKNFHKKQKNMNFEQVEAQMNELLFEGE